MVECSWWDPADSHGGQCGVARSGEKISAMSTAKRHIRHTLRKIDVMTLSHDT
jgi:hypothetical protein